MRLNKYLPFAILYFFFNSLGLPFGVTYTVLLAPLFYVWIISVRRTEILWPFVLMMIPFVLLHLFVVGVDTPAYFRSLLNLGLVYIFCQAAYTFLMKANDKEKIFHAILIVNFLFCMIAIPLYFSPYWHWLWMEQNISTGVKNVRRLRLLTYEPSYYALLFTPVFFYFLLQYFFSRNKIKGWMLLPMLLLPLVLSFSVGVVAAILIAMIVTALLHLRRLLRIRRVLNAVINTSVLFISSITMMLLFFRRNAAFARLANIFEGNDSSGNGRTVDAFVLAAKILHQRNAYWGVGLGQVKLVGTDIIRSFYFYYQDYAVAIPNAAAETLAIFGWTGFAIRILAEIFFFFLTRVYTNYYRSLLFFFMFVYQFTGSFITNVAEYMIWIIAFCRFFPQFDIRTTTYNNGVEESRPPSA